MFIFVCQIDLQIDAFVATLAGSASAITRIFPSLEHKLDGRAVRVPLVVGASLVDFHAVW